MWYKDGKPLKNPVKLAINGKEVITFVSPAKLADKNNQLLIDNGFVWVEPVPVEDPHDWRDKETFIAAVKTLIPADKLVEILGDAVMLKEAIAGLALLTTDAAPGGMIDVADSRVAQFLSLSGLTVEQVLEAMK